MSDKKAAKIAPDKGRNVQNLPTSNENPGDKTLEPLHLSKVIDEENRGSAFENTGEIDTKNDRPKKDVSLLNPGGESRASLNSNTDLQSKPLLGNEKGLDAKVKSQVDNVALTKTLIKQGVTLFSYDPATLQKYEARARKAPISYTNLYRSFFFFFLVLFIILIAVTSSQKVGEVKQKVTANFVLNEYPLQVNKTTMPFNSFSVFSEDNLESKLAELMWDENKRVYGDSTRMLQGQRRNLAVCIPALAATQIENGDGTCTTCSSGTAPNTQRTKCVPQCSASQTLNADETVCNDACSSNQINKADGSCQLCFNPQVPNAAQTECVIVKQVCSDYSTFINKPSDGSCALCLSPKVPNEAKDECVIVKAACLVNQINSADGTCKFCDPGQLADATFEKCIKQCEAPLVPNNAQTECIEASSGTNFDSGSSGGSNNQALLNPEIITITMTFTAGYEFQYMFSPPDSIINTISTQMELSDPANTIKFVSGKSKDATNYEIVYTLTGVDKTTAGLLEENNKAYFLNDIVDLKAPIITVKIKNHFNEENDLVTDGIAKSYPASAPIQIKQLTKGDNYASLVNQIKIVVQTEITLQPEEYYKWLFLNQPTDLVQKIKADAGFKTDFSDYWSLTDVTGTELKVGESYKISYSFTDYNVDVATTHIRVNTEFYALNTARLYAPITTVKVTKTDTNGASSNNIVENSKVVAANYDQVTLSSGANYQSELDKIALRVTTKIIMTIGEVGGENYQYLIDLPNIITTIASQMGLADQNAIYIISQEAKTETYELTYGIKAYNSEPITQYETLNKDYYINNKAQLEAPITSVYVTTDSGGPYDIVKDGVLNPALGTIPLTSGSGMTAKLNSLATSLSTVVTFTAPEEFKYSQGQSPIDSIVGTIATQMGIDQSSITFTSSNVGASGAEYIVKYKITEYNSVSLTSAETKQTNYFTQDKADLVAPILTIFVTFPGKNPYFIVQQGKVVLDGYNAITLSKGSNYNSTLESQGFSFTTTILFEAGYEYEHFYGASLNSFTDRIAEQQNILPWNRVRKISFGSLSDTVYKAVYTTTAYNSIPSKAYEEAQIVFFATDQAQLIAPIKEVEVIPTSGATYKIIEDNKIVYTGYERTSLTSGSDYQQQVQALTEVSTTTTVILKAGDEYDTFVPNAESFTSMLSSQMGIRASDIRRISAETLNDRVGEEEYKIVYQIIDYHTKSAENREQLQLNYYIDNKARLIAPIKSVQVLSHDGNSYYIIQDSKIEEQYQKTESLTSGYQWQQKLQDNFFKTVSSGSRNKVLDAVPSDAVRTTVKMDGNYNNFRNGGQETFITNLARSLNIDYSQITIKNHYSGSIVVTYDLTPATGQTRDEIRATQSDAYARGQIDLGSPITDVTTIDADNSDPSVIVEDGQAADVINGQTKFEYIRSLKVEDFRKYLCDKAKLSLNFKDLDQNSQQTYFTGCSVINEPSQPFSKLILHHQMTDTDTLSYKNKRFLTAEQSLAYNYNSELNGLKLESQQLSLIYEDTKSSTAKYPDLLFDKETTNTIFTTKGEQIIGQKTIPNNLHVQYWSDVNVTNEGKGNKKKGAQNDTSLVFEKFGPIQPIEGTWAPEFFINFDYHERVTSFQFFTFADAVFDTIIALPLTVGALLAVFLTLNLILFYRKLAELIQRRYSDALQFQKIQKYINKFEKIHSALEDIEQFKPILDEIKTFMDENYDQKTYDEIDVIVKKMSDLDNMLPNLDDLEQSIGAKVDPKKVTPADEILNKRANMDIFEIIDLVKDRVSIFGIYKLHDEVHIENSKLGAEIKLANSKLEYLYRQLDKKRSSTKKQTSGVTPTSRTKTVSAGEKEKAN